MVGGPGGRRGRALLATTRRLGVEGCSFQWSEPARTRAVGSWAGDAQCLPLRRLLLKVMSSSCGLPQCRLRRAQIKHHCGVGVFQPGSGSGPDPRPVPGAHGGHKVGAASLQVNIELGALRGGHKGRERRAVHALHLGDELVNVAVHVACSGEECPGEGSRCQSKVAPQLAAGRAAPESTSMTLAWTGRQRRGLTGQQHVVSDVDVAGLGGLQSGLRAGAKSKGVLAAYRAY
jgi:hypothetical protein